ncbi:unnamed protein product [Adineta ricciae]|uniref:F-box domain-containing protein n=1 Tax=Adineta ricciae TaxID=249248 RepID=A0A815DT92_ADIRI|nr:unnamed protein product [Adineta ricciae]CAF1302659.1 unnamed protein product [Adineta ricciae]
MSCYLNQFPIEIFHIIFEYLWAHDILYSFRNINDYIDNILSNYQYYVVNFKSIRRSHFDLVCQLRADQIISLILSDNVDTPKQSRLFQSNFSIEQFTRLRSLKCIEVDDEDDVIFPHLFTLPQLRSVEIHLKFKVPLIIAPPSLRRFTIETSPKIQLNLDLGITLVQFGHLRELTLPICPCSYLQRIFYEASQLTALKISFIFLNPNDLTTLVNIHQYSKSPPLTSLSLSLTENCGTIKRIHIEQFLAPFKYLKNLELIIPSPTESQLADGRQWESFITESLPSLGTFHFNFYVLTINLRTLNQFRRPFWIDRRWYVACDFNQSLIFSVPHFAPTSRRHSLKPVPFHQTTLPIELYNALDNRVTQLILDSERKKSCSHYYRNIEKLKIYGHYIQKNLLDLSKVTSFVVNSPEWSFQRIVKSIEQSMPNVNHLSLICTYPNTDSFTKLEQIRTLVLPHYGELSDGDQCFIDWSCHFPRVERLTASVTSKKQIPFLIDQFKYLISGYFFALPSDIDMKKRIKLTPSWLIKHTQRLRGGKTNNFTCDIYDPCFLALSIWIDDKEKFDDNKTLVKNRKWSWGRCFT